MAGKSTYMRQNALIALMAQIGSFVPAAKCRVGVVDAIFTRVGASDDLAAGQSTFMVEMTEVAEILQHATKRSLVILDEIGRGTSTFDGMSIARAVVEYICDKIGCKTLFATHYHELTGMEQDIEGVKNYNIAVKKRVTTSRSCAASLPARPTTATALRSPSSPACPMPSSSGPTPCCASSKRRPRAKTGRCSWISRRSKPTRTRPCRVKWWTSCTASMSKP